MRKLIVLTLFSGVLAFSVSEARAACGGGGWRSSTSASKPAAVEVHVQPVVVQVSEGSAEPIAYRRLTTSSKQSPAAFDSQFQGVSAQLNLDESQWKDVNNAKDNVSKRIAKLEKKQARAEDKLAHCTGDCEEEVRGVSRAKDALQSYNGNAEFERELKSILTARQWDLYNSAVVSAAK
jgi:hypothetical protein